MKKLFICCDGTWGSPVKVQYGVSATTNVHRFYCALAERDADGNEQRRYYHPGVGTSGSLCRQLTDGMTGAGLSLHIQGAYKWLSDNYSDGDLIYLLGFSRGAYTVRSLGGMIEHYGIQPNGCSWDEVKAVYQAYRRHVCDQDMQHEQPDERGRRIHFIGVWDTVGSLGIPLRMRNLPGCLGRWLGKRQAKRNSFHDTHLAPGVSNAFQALAIDEQREDFQPTLWSNPPAVGQRIEQVYFAGVHADVGGGYKNRGLADITLDWMMERAAQCGVAFKTDMRRQVCPVPNSHQSNLHNSRTGIFNLAHYLPRTLPYLTQAENSGVVHESVRQRIARPPIGQATYWPGRVLQSGERSEAIRVFARDRWNAAGLYLEAGEYRFSATGQWLDASYKSGPQGSDEGWLRRMFTCLKRHGEYKWLELVGCVANRPYDPHITHKKLFEQAYEPVRHQHFSAHDNQRVVIERPGYLYFFANDAWCFYFNNSGSVQVEVTCLQRYS